MHNYYNIIEVLLHRMGHDKKKRKRKYTSGKIVYTHRKIKASNHQAACPP